MGNDAYRQVNLQLHRAQLLYKAMSTGEQGTALAAAQRHSFMLQLAYCYRCFLVELTHSFSVNVTAFCTAIDLLAAIRDADAQQIPELALLAEREQQSHWLQAVLQSAAPLPDPNSPKSATDMQAAAKANVSSSIINTSQVADFKKDAISLEECEIALSSLKNSIEECRLTTQEW